MHDMEKIDEYRNILAMPLCKLSIDKLVQEICLHPAEESVPENQLS